jgi:signal transduction protein with GAF and PtsI domain
MSVNLETEVELLKREMSDMKQIHVRLDSAIEKIADVSSKLHTIMAVHEEKLIRQEEDLESQEKRLNENIAELHSRITSNTKNLTLQIVESERRLVDAMNDHMEKESEHFNELRNSISKRVGVLEEWRWIIVGGSIVAGFILQKLPIWG